MTADGLVTAAVPVVPSVTAATVHDDGTAVDVDAAANTGPWRRFRRLVASETLELRDENEARLIQKSVERDGYAAYKADVLAREQFTHMFALCVTGGGAVALMGYSEWYDLADWLLAGWSETAAWRHGAADVHGEPFGSVARRLAPARFRALLGTGAGSTGGGVHDSYEGTDKAHLPAHRALALKLLRENPYRCVMSLKPGSTFEAWRRDLQSLLGVRTVTPAFLAAYERLFSVRLTGITGSPAGGPASGGVTRLQVTQVQYTPASADAALATFERHLAELRPVAVPAAAPVAPP